MSNQPSAWDALVQTVVGSVVITGQVFQNSMGSINNLASASNDYTGEIAESAKFSRIENRISNVDRLEKLQATNKDKLAKANITPEDLEKFF